MFKQVISALNFNGLETPMYSPMEVSRVFLDSNASHPSVASSLVVSLSLLIS